MLPQHSILHALFSWKSRGVRLILAPIVYIINFLWSLGVDSKFPFIIEIFFQIIAFLKTFKVTWLLTQKGAIPINLTTMREFRWALCEYGVSSHIFWGPGIDSQYDYKRAALVGKNMCLCRYMSLDAYKYSLPQSLRIKPNKPTNLMTHGPWEEGGLS